MSSFKGDTVTNIYPSAASSLIEQALSTDLDNLSRKGYVELALGHELDMLKERNRHSEAMMDRSLKSLDQLALLGQEFFRFQTEKQRSITAEINSKSFEDEDVAKLEKALKQAGK